ncbi:hypothetical protein PsYK624_082340 [Phanerochaete sordida]|uniref:Protein kinase domain-containing protein n=1 Tax=Phanerochaete sordida TaxID=48140 RepID=A0A9P3LE27_9APHY|nr:hypothetical protein PsYK624_082340 [Phanerochaete sordida]
MFSANDIVGAMPPKEFLVRFMSLRGDLPPAPCADFAQVCSAKSDVDAQRAFIRAVEDSHISPHLRFYIPKLKQRQLDILEDEFDDREDCGLYFVTPHLSVAACKMGEKRGKRSKKDFSQQHDFATSALDVEITLDKTEEPFKDPKEDFLGPSRGKSTTATSKAGIFGSFERYGEDSELQERLVKSAAALFGRQHRTFIFQLVICSNSARFLLLDHAGAIATRRFDYVQNPDLLADFLWRFSHMDDTARGFDPSAVLATPQQEKLFTNAVRSLLRKFEHAAREQENPRILTSAKDTLDPSGTYPAYKILVVDNATGDATELIVRRYFMGENEPLFGRGTRVYLAYDLKAQRLVTLKDVWRSNHDLARAEYEILRDMHANDVPFIPKVLYGGDVFKGDDSDVPQQTVVDELSVEEAGWRCTDTPIGGRVHHRMVQDILYTLCTARDERELIQALHDAIIALDTAHEKLGIIHRDICYDNVMLDSEGRCVLVNWDRAGPFSPYIDSSGTVPFMSIRLLRDESGSLPNELVDDLQSVFWVLNFASVLRFALHTDNLDQSLFVDRSHFDLDYTGVVEAKVSGLSDRSLFKGRYYSAVLTDLIAELVHDWDEYERASHRSPAGEPVPGGQEKREILDLACQPSYWLEKFAAALRKYDEKARAMRAQKVTIDDAGSVEDKSKSRGARAGRKRKLVEAVDGDPDSGKPDEAGDNHQTVRRSKRIRT